MADGQLIHTDCFVQPYSDPCGLGQRKVAEIHRDQAVAEMARHAPDAFDVGYVSPEWRAMRRRRFAEARADHDRAKAILEGWA